jgi:hypothetical protein
VETDRPDPAETAEENLRYRRLQTIIALATATLSQDPGLTPEQGIRLILWARDRAVELFPGKETTFDLIYRPRLVRILEERFGRPIAGADGGAGTGAEPGS